MKNAIIIGGGISGMCCAVKLAEAEASTPCCPKMIRAIPWPAISRTP